MRARWFDPTVQKFISRDPIGLQGGSNLYRYCGNSPVNWNDPQGLYTDDYIRKIRCRIQESSDLMNDFVRDKHRELAPYANGANNSKIAMGGSLLGWAQGANAQTDQRPWGTTIFLSQNTLDADYSVEFTAWTLLHEGLHASKSSGWNMTHPSQKETEAYRIINSGLLTELEKYSTKWKKDRKKAGKQCCD